MLTKFVLLLICLFVIRKSYQYLKSHFTLLGVFLILVALINIFLLVYSQFDSIIWDNNILIAKSPNIFSNGFDQLMVIIWGIVFLIINMSYKHLFLNNVATKIVRATAIERALDNTKEEN